MAYTDIRNLFWPFYVGPGVLGWTNSTAPVLDANDERCAFIGHVYWAGRAASKTINTTGSSKIWLVTGATAVFDNASSVMDIGIQGVTTTGPPAVPDLSYTVKAVVTTAADTTPALTTINSSVAVTPTTGTATIAHGDLIAVVCHFVTKAGSDAMTFQTGGAMNNLPVSNAFASAAWGASGANLSTDVILVASDGTIGWLDGQVFSGLAAATTWQDSTNPDERGCIFQVPFNCKADAFWTMMRIQDANSDFDINLWENAESSASSLKSASFDAAKLGTISVDRPLIIPFAAEQTLVAATDYCVSVKATSTQVVRVTTTTLGDAAHRVQWPGGTTIRSVTRNGGTGNFGSSSTTVHYPMGVRISQIETSSSGGSGGVSRSRVQLGH